jgi:hypothetical protein
MAVARARAAAAPMTHAEFVAGHRGGMLRVSIDRRGAARLVSRRLLLPFVLLPVLGSAVALAMTGRFFAGAALLVAGLALRFLVRASGRGYVLNRALQDPVFYEEVTLKHILLVEPSIGKAD